jgi:hypothetical protein
MAVVPPVVSGNRSSRDRLVAASSSHDAHNGGELYERARLRREPGDGRRTLPDL